MPNGTAMLTPITCQALVSAIYDGAADSSGWEAALHRIQSELALEGIVVAVRHDAQRQISVAHSIGFGADARGAYESKWGPRDPSVRGLLQLPIGQATATNFHYSDRDWRRVDYVQGFALPQGTFHQIGVIVGRGGGRTRYLGGARASGRSTFDRGHAQALDFLAPHVERAMLLQERIFSLTEQSKLMSEVLDRIRYGLLMLSEDGRIVLANKKAEEFLSRPTGLGASQGKISLPGSVRDALVQRLIREAVATGAGKGTGAGGYVVVSEGTVGERLIANIVPISATRQAFDFTRRRICSVVFLHREGESPRPTEEQLSSQFGLTPAEARLAKVMSEGGSVSEYAANQGLSKHTVRSQLRSVFGKTGTHRQAQLASLLAGVPVIERRI